MRIFLAVASGVIGVRLVPLLARDGHDIIGLPRTPAKTGMLRDLGAEPVVCDVHDLEALTAAVVAARPDVVLDELTDLPDDPALIAELGAASSRIRREGTRNLLAAARAAGVRRFLTQSVAWPLPGDGGAAVGEHERIVLEAGGVVLRYGRFYGPGTYHESESPEPPRVHVDEAAARTLPALEAPSGIITIAEHEARPA
jgi:nucleoside-diphosphate-sugar epimerase